MDAAVAAAEASKKLELNTLKASALANLTYLQLQQQHWQQAVAYCDQLLEVICPSSACLCEVCGS